MPYVYLIQPVELVGTNRYKIGMSLLSNLSRVRSYKCGTRYLCICECNDTRNVERRLINEFNVRYKRIAGNEYFQTDDEKGMIKTFMEIVMRDCIAECTVSAPVCNNSNSWMEKFGFKHSI